MCPAPLRALAPPAGCSPHAPDPCPRLPSQRPGRRRSGGCAHSGPSTVGQTGSEVLASARPHPRKRRPRVSHPTTMRAPGCRRAAIVPPEPGLQQGPVACHVARCCDGCHLRVDTGTAQPLRSMSGSAAVEHRPGSHISTREWCEEHKCLNMRSRAARPRSAKTGHNSCTPYPGPANAALTK